MPSATAHPEVVTAYLQKEQSLGRLLGPFPPSHLLPPTQLNRFGVIPKGHNTGKWRLITDLSHPPTGSVNGGIEPELCSLSYTTVDDIANRILHIGKGALLAKVDIEAAYRLIPVHPDDRPLQAVQWNGSMFIDPMLPFRLRSAPKIFNAVADALNWHLTQTGVPEVYHYLDDFIVIGQPNSSQCHQYLEILERECRSLGVPLAAHKREGPSSTLTFLGIEIDTVVGQLCLPSDKLKRLVTTITQWGTRRTCSKQELQSLIALLNHACKVIRPGRTFLRRMIDLVTTVRSSAPKSATIRLNNEFRADLAWWAEFLSQWNGSSFFPPPLHIPRLALTSDASGSWGCGAWHGTAWFQIRWNERAQPLTIAEKELIPIIVACATWGQSWQGKHITCYCDNQVVVACLRSRTSRHMGMMHLIRCLAFVEARLKFTLASTYVTTKANFLADDLSRNQLPSFHLKPPLMDRQPSQTPLALMHLLLNEKADWTSSQWRPQFSAIFKQD